MVRKNILRIDLVFIYFVLFSLRFSCVVVDVERVSGSLGGGVFLVVEFKKLCIFVIFEFCFFFLVIEINYFL